MYYCENCHLICEGPVCPYCGSTSLRAPKGGDFCYLSTMVSPWGEAMQELLKEAGIRCLTRQARSVLYSVAFGQNHAELSCSCRGRIWSRRQAFKKVFSPASCWKKHRRILRTNHHNAIAPQRESSAVRFYSVRVRKPDRQGCISFRHSSGALSYTWSFAASTVTGALEWRMNSAS